MSRLYNLFLIKKNPSYDEFWKLCWSNGNTTSIGNDITDGVPFFVSIDEILEINHKPILSGSVVKSLKEVS